LERFESLKAYRYSVQVLRRKQMTKFRTGDTIVHPFRGAGTVVRLMERPRHGNNEIYYKVKLVAQPDISLMVPTSAVETLGLRHTIPQSQIKKVWRVLHTDPTKLPDEHKERYKVLEGKLHTGNIFQVAEAVRDMDWRQQCRGNLTTKERRLYDEGMNILAGEIAAVQGVDLLAAQTQIMEKLSEIQG
jgi:CarD family transcriptional regulator